MFFSSGYVLEISKHIHCLNTIQVAFQSKSFVSHVNCEQWIVRQSLRIHCCSMKRPSKRSVYSLANKKWLPSHISTSKLQIMSLRETFNWIKSFLLLIFNSSLLGYVICQLLITFDFLSLLSWTNSPLQKSNISFMYICN